MVLNKGKGVIYGLAIGDAPGRLNEFMSFSVIKRVEKSDYLEDLSSHLHEKKRVYESR